MTTTPMLIGAIFLSLLLFFSQVVSIVKISLMAIDRSIKAIGWKVTLEEEIWLMTFSLTTLYISHYLLSINPI